MNKASIRGCKSALALGAAATLVACASVPANNAVLDEAKASYERATNNAYAARGGTVELQRARVALQRAQAALEAGEEAAVVEHYAYLAKRAIDTALEAGKIIASDEAVVAAAAERQRIMIDLRTREAEAMQQRAAASAADAVTARKLAWSNRSRQQPLASRPRSSLPKRRLRTPQRSRRMSRPSVSRHSSRK